MPRRMFSSARAWRWESSSACNCDSECSLPNVPRMRAKRVRRTDIGTTLFVAQRQHRIDPCGAARGNIAGQDHHAGQTGGQCGKESRIKWLHIIEKTRHGSRYERGSECAGHDASKREANAFADDEPLEVAGLGAKTQANAHLASTLRDPIAHHTVDADCGQNQGERCEQSEKQTVRTRLGGILTHALAQSG